MLIRKNIKKYAKKGQVAVEAAILLPLFIIGVLTIGYLLKFCMISEGVHHALTDESHRIMADAPVILYPAAGAQELSRRIEGESRGEAQNIQIGRFAYRVPGVSKGGRAYTDLIAISVSFDTPLKLPRLFLGEVKGERTALCRAFVGMTHNGPVKPFSEMEEGGNGDTAWVFPRAGERYHDEHCRYIETYPREVLLDRDVRRRFSPCQLCEPESRRDGALVYVFFTSGHAYHIGECTVVERYVIEISKDDAAKQDYKPCSVCGGG
ncbi:MAG: hypothetical protein FWG03_06755 [Clostridiales bacterium]|nr:hypothetical protein [Clostridiales bacterium]